MVIQSKGSVLRLYNHSKSESRYLSAHHNLILEEPVHIKFSNLSIWAIKSHLFRGKVQGFQTEYNIKGKTSSSKIIFECSTDFPYYEETRKLWGISFMWEYHICIRGKTNVHACVNFAHFRFPLSLRSVVQVNYLGPVPERRHNSIPGINMPYSRDNFIPRINSVPERRNSAIQRINLG